MNKLKWLYISFFGFLLSIALASATACTPMHGWRGTKAASYGVLLALIVASSIVTFLIQLLKISRTPGSKVGGVLFVLALIFVAVFTAANISKQYCH